MEMNPKLLNMKFAAFCSFLVLLTVTVRNAESCSCLRLHPQTAFKLAEFVIVGKIRNTLPGTNAHSEVSVTVTHVYKGENPAQGITKNKTIVLRSIRYCDIYLVPGQKYVISGSIVDGIPNNSICGLNIPWATEVTEERERAFEIFADASNECEVPLQTEEEKPTDKQCIVNKKPEIGECQYKYGVCIKNDGVCTWNPSKSYQDCLKSPT